MDFALDQPLRGAWWEVKVCVHICLCVLILHSLIG